MPPGPKILEITYSNFVVARGLYAFATLTPTSEPGSIIEAAPR